MLTGREDDLRRRLRRGRTGLRNCARVFTRCRNLFPLDGSMDGYWNAVQRAIDICSEEGYYFSPVLIVDRCREESPGKFVDVLSIDQTREWVREWLRRFKHDHRLFWSLVNEPEQPWQGFGSPLNPDLLAMADVMAQELGHKDFVIGAAPDGDNVDASKETLDQCVVMAKLSNVVAIHNSRKGGTEPSTDGRFRRWIDHLEGMYDIVAACRKVNIDVVGYHEEATGHASVRWVPLSNGRHYEREADPEAALAAAVTSETSGLVYCYHYISSQDDGTPGLAEIGQVLAHYPAGWRYVNDSWGGSPSSGFTDDAGHEIEGKVRHYVSPDSQEARTLAYARTQVPAVHWGNGYRPDAPALFQGARVACYKVRRA